MRRLVFNMRDERPVWAPPSWVVPALRAELGTGWEVTEVDAPVSGRGDGAGTTGAALEAVRGAEVYFALGLPRTILQAALAPPSRLRWVHTGAAGVRSLLHPGITDGNVALTNSAGIHAEPMAETVLGMILHFARGLDLAVHAQQRREWGVERFEAKNSGVREVAGATLGIAGYGGIGRAVARRAAALGMKVIATRRSGGHVPGIEILHGDGALEALLRTSDFVLLALPSTPETERLIDGARLALMKRDAVLINVGRGDVLDEAALHDALAGGRLRGAALDVYAQEPLPPDSPLWALPNLLVTPHVSATSDRYWEREFALMKDNVQRYLAGDPLLNRVNVETGY